MIAQAMRSLVQPRYIAHPMCRGRCSGHFWRAQQVTPASAAMWRKEWYLDLRDGQSAGLKRDAI